MSKVVIPFLKGSALSGPVYASVNQFLAKLVPSVELKTVTPSNDRSEVSALLRGSNNIGIGSALTSDEMSKFGLFDTVVTATAQSPKLDLSPDYSGSEVTVVRALTSEPPQVTIRYRDRVDMFPAQGVGIEEESKAVAASFRAASRKALEIATRSGRQHISLVIKPLSRYEKLNELFLQTAKEIMNSAPGLTVEVTHTAQLHNELIMFPERLGVVLANDVNASDILENIVTGIAGGAGICHKVLYGSNGTKVYCGAASDVNSSGTLFSAAAALSDLGLENESKEAYRILNNALKVAGTRTIDLEGGKLDVNAFTKAVCA